MMPNRKMASLLHQPIFELSRSCVIPSRASTDRTIWCRYLGLDNVALKRADGQARNTPSDDIFVHRVVQREPCKDQLQFILSSRMCPFDNIAQ